MTVISENIKYLRKKLGDTQGDFADKISINSAAVDNPGLIDKAANQFGTQCVVLSIDYKQDQQGNYQVWTQNGNQKTPLDN